MNILKKEHILITGGSGLIGTYLTKELLKTRKYQITIVDKRSLKGNFQEELTRFPYKITPRVKGIRFVKSDFSNIKIMLPLLKKADYLFHLAAMVGVDNCRLNPKEVIKVNLTDTKKLIDWCVRSKIKKIIFASSSEIYGNSKELPFGENNKPSPISDYAKCKLKIEKYLKKVQEKSSMKVGIVRFFNVYGPGQKDMVIPIFIDAASKNEPLTVLGDGNQTRTFMYAEDAARGIHKIFNFDSDYEIFNIGSEDEIKIKDLAKIILKLFPLSTSKIVFVPYGGKFRDKELEIYRRVPSLDKAKHLLKFKAKNTLEQGIKKYLTEYVI